MSIFTCPKVLTFSLFLRLILLIYGIFQDTYSPLPYTDIDYYVFTDAARYTYQHRSPYLRETYRYTPLLAWLLIPTAWSPQWLWFSFGKILFSLADVTAGWLIALVLQGKGMEMEKALKFACVWLLNPMVATISTRGSSEGLLGIMVVALLWATTRQQIVLAGLLLGLAVHFKIYPFIYGVSILWYLVTPSQPSRQSSENSNPENPTPLDNLLTFFNRPRITLLLTSLLTFSALNLLMYALYGHPFLQHTFMHHLTRIDHRHNFSVWNTLLHLSSAHPSSISGLRFERLAFVPQLLLSAFFIPLALAKRDLAGAMLCQTWAFVAFNKVVTSQYFMWYLVLLPFYLPYSSFLSEPRLGFVATVLWVGTQAIWLQQAYALEFLGKSTFVPGLFSAGLAFFVVNGWMLGVMIADVGARTTNRPLNVRKSDTKPVDKAGVR